MEDKFNFKDIRVNSLEELAKYNKEILEHANILAEGDREVALDGVQNMYLNINKYINRHPNTTVNGNLVSLSIRNCIRDIWRKENRTTTLDYVEEGTYEVEDFDLVKEDTYYERFISSLSEEDQYKLSLYAKYRTKEVAEIEGKGIKEVRIERREFKDKLERLYNNK